MADPYGRTTDKDLLLHGTHPALSGHTEKRSLYFDQVLFKFSSIIVLYDIFVYLSTNMFQIFPNLQRGSACKNRSHPPVCADVPYLETSKGGVSVGNASFFAYFWLFPLANLTNSPSRCDRARILWYNSPVRFSRAGGALFSSGYV